MTVPTESPPPWPSWDGQALPEGRALLVRAGPRLADNLAGLGALAAVADRGVRILLAAPESQTELLGKAWGVWAVWPQPEVDAGRPPPSPGALVDSIGAQVDLAELAASPGAPAGPAPRIHLPAAALQAIEAQWAALGASRRDRLLIGTLATDAGPAWTHWPAHGDAETVACASWQRTDATSSVPSVDLGPWPDPASWLACAQRVALLDLLLTDDPTAAHLAAALGKPVWWLGDPAGPPGVPAGDWQRPGSADPAELAATVSAWAAPRRSALRTVPLDDAQAAMDGLMAAGQRGEAHAAQAGCQQLLISHPNRPDAWRLLGLLAQHGGRPERAVAAYARVTRIAPLYPDGWRSLGLLQLDQGDTEAATQSLAECVRLAPADHEARGQLARLHADAGRRGDAIALLRAGIPLQPGALEWHQLLGRLLVETDQADSALDHLRQVLGSIDAAHPLHAPTQEWLGHALHTMGDAESAAACYRQVLNHEPQHLDVSLALSRVYREGGQAGRAAALIEPLAAAQPGHAGLALEARLLRRLRCDWRDEPGTGRLLALAGARLPAVDAPTLALLAEDLDDAELAPWIAARLRRAGAPPPSPFPAVATANEPPAAASAPTRSRTRSRARPRVAYLGSAASATGRAGLLAALLQAHRHDRFDVHVCTWAAPTHPDDAQADDAPSHLPFEVLRLPGVRDVEIAERLHAEGFDILVDLDGIGPGARPGVWAQRPAPRQLAWLDAVGAPVPSHFDCRLDALPAVVPLPADRLGAGSAFRRQLRAALGLPQAAPVLACLAPHVRLDPASWAAWMRLMQACPPAVLWLQPGTPESQRALRQAAAAAGVAGPRLVFAAPPYRLPDGSPPAHALAAADLYLPPRVQLTEYSSGSSRAGTDGLAAALAAAVPMLCPSDSERLRAHGAALLKAAGLPDSVWADASACETEARRLLRSPRELLGRRDALIQAHRSAPLFDVRRLAEALEQAWEAHTPHHKAPARPGTVRVPEFSG